jgi:hypothetical protein
MDFPKLLKNLLAGKQKRKPNVGQAGNYAAPVDAEGVDPEMRETLGLVAAPADTIVAAKRKPAPARKVYR